MSRWGRLREEIEREREQQRRYDLSLITAVIKRLCDGGRCDERAVHWLATAQGTGRSTTYAWSDGADARDDRNHRALRLQSIPMLAGGDGPVLSLRGVLDRAARVRSFNLGVDGVRSPDGRWYARMELTEKPEGKGDCGHPLLHAHVGDDPDAALSPRVPLPWLLPHEALEWLFATIDPTLEPSS